MEDRSTNIFKSRSDFQKELVSLWRVVVAVVLAQVLAGCVAVIFEPYGFWFIDFWFGGAVATIFGYSIGLIWQLKVVSDSWHAHRNMLSFMGVMSVVLFIAAFTLPLEQAAAQSKESTGSRHGSSVRVIGAEGNQPSEQDAGDQAPAAVD